MRHQDQEYLGVQNMEDYILKKDYVTWVDSSKIKKNIILILCKIYLRIQANIYFLKIKKK